jgi:hypothetical protein
MEAEQPRPDEADETPDAPEEDPYDDPDYTGDGPGGDLKGG